MFLAIDPGYNAMGWATFSGDRKTDFMMSAGVFKESKNMKSLQWFAKVSVFQERLEKIIRNDIVHGQMSYVVCEEMRVMEGPEGYAAARTSLMGLAGTVGMWAAWAYKFNAVFCLAPIVEWKGQLPKAVVNKRIKATLSPNELKLLTKPASHDWDAAGIGLWYQGRF